MTPLRLDFEIRTPQAGDCDGSSCGWRKIPCLLASTLLSLVTANAFGGTPLFADLPPELTAKTNSSIPKAGSIATNLSAPTVTNTTDILDDKHRLAIGDRLSFRIEEDQEEPKPLFVTDSGDLEVPYIGRFPAENKTCKQLAVELKAALEKEYYYQATVILAVDVMVKTRGKVYLVGPVRVPGPIEMPSDETLTLSKAILRAGGFSDFADRRHVQITRKAAGATDKQSFMVDVGQIFDKGKIENDVTLEPGDLIFVPERTIRF
jgi:protein involved in polysaccharide export with SLBB domain